MVKRQSSRPPPGLRRTGRRRLETDRRRVKTQTVCSPRYPPPITPAFFRSSPSFRSHSKICCTNPGRRFDTYIFPAQGSVRC
jgi:hypothetical protein